MVGVVARAEPPGALLLGSDFKALAVARSLGRRGIPVALVDSLPRSAWFSRYVRRRFRWHGPMEGAGFLGFLTGLAQRHGLRGWVLLPMQDEVVELVSRQTGALGAHYRLATQGWEVVGRAHDKRQLHALAERIGVPSPRTWYPDGEAALLSCPITFPAIVKPAASIRMQYGLGRKALPADDRATLLQQYRTALALMPADQLMVQEVIPGDGQTQRSVAAFCVEGRMLAAMTARRTRQFPIDYGLSSSFVEAVEIPGLIRLAQRLLEALGLSGMVEVEFKHDRRDGQDKLLDVNVRPWGWHALCTASGIDFSHLQYRLALGEPLPAAAPTYGRRWRRLVTDVPAALQELRAGRLTAGQLVRSFASRSVGSVIDLRDPLPAAGDLAVLIIRALHPRRRADEATEEPQGLEPVVTP